MSRERRVTVRGIIVKDGKMLAQQLKAPDGGARDYWCTPGGGLDLGESLHQGLHREMIEETGIAPTIGKLLFVQQYQDDGREFLEFFFHITNSDDYAAIDLATTTHGPLEIAHVDFVDPRTCNVLPNFLQQIDLLASAQSHEPVLIASDL